MTVAVKYIFVEYIDQSAKTGLEQRVFPYTIQTCICFDHMQMSVHGLAFIRVLVTQTHVLNLLPGTGEGLEISVLFLVETMVFNRMEQSDCIFQSLGISCRPVQFRQSIDGKSDGIDLFLCIKRPVLRIKCPICTSELRIIEFIDYKILRPEGNLQVFGISENSVRRSESP